MADVVAGSDDVDMIWWVLGAAIVVIVGLVYVKSHESDFCAGSVEPGDPGVAPAPAAETPRAA
jgi:hypothetical protein